MIVLCSGDREWDDLPVIQHCFDELIDEFGEITLVVQGECRGADIMCRDEAKRRDIPVVGYPANWNKYGKSAGPIRNREMLDKHPDVDLVIGFHNNLEESKGTKDMLTEAQRREINTLHIRVNGDAEPSLWNQQQEH